MSNNYFDQVQNKFLEITLYFEGVHMASLFFLIVLLLDFCGYSESLCDVCTV